MFNGKTHYKWSFSIAMLNYQRVPTKLGDFLANVGQYSTEHVEKICKYVVMVMCDFVMSCPQ